LRCIGAFWEEHLRRLIYRVAALIGACALTAAPPLAADHDHSGDTLEAFLSVHGVAGARGDSHERQEDSWGVADFVFSLSRERVRLLGEFDLSPIEHELERLQLGYELVPDTMLWFGRFQQPASAWNNRFHHGRYVQTAIVRPSIENWEDEGGLIPQHLTGALLESRRPLGDTAGMQVSLGAGYGSSLDSEGLNPIELLHGNSGGHALSETARLAFLPQYLGASNMGLLLAHHRLRVIDAPLATRLGAGELDQYLNGLYADWAAEPWHVMAAAYYVRLTLQGQSDRGEHFVAGYLQAERELKDGFTLYARHENSAGTSGSRYVALRGGDFVVRGNLAGTRWDYAQHQALTLELGYANLVRKHESTARIQWSGAIP
jgi:hypothetical protein